MFNYIYFRLGIFFKTCITSYEVQTVNNVFFKVVIFNNCFNCVVLKKIIC